MPENWMFAVYWTPVGPSYGLNCVLVVIESEYTCFYDFERSSRNDCGDAEGAGNLVGDLYPRFTEPHKPGFCLSFLAGLRLFDTTYETVLI